MVNPEPLLQFVEHFVITWYMTERRAVLRTAAVGGGGQGSLDR
jgi:hypothetical protein